MGRLLKTPKRVLAAMTWEEGHQLVGLMRYAHAARWTVRIAGPLDSSIISQWKPDGIVSQLYHSNPELVETVQQAGVPTVELCDYIPSMRVPRVMMDLPSAGRAVADYFIERSYRRLVNVGYARARTRPNQFACGLRERAEQGGIEPLWVDLDDPAFWRRLGIEAPEIGLSWELSQQGATALAAWLVKDSEPAALFCEDLTFATDLVDGAMSLGLSVPEQISVLSVSARQHENELASIPVTCIEHDLEGQSYRAAETLDRMMRGDVVPEVQWVPFKPIKTLESTDTFSTRQLQFALAMKHIRHHACASDFSLERTADELGVTRRTLYRWFSQHTGKTPAAFVEERRVEKAVTLLQASHISVEEAASQSGFTDKRHLRRTLRRCRNTTPHALRRSPESAFGKA